MWYACLLWVCPFSIEFFSPLGFCYECFCAGFSPAKLFPILRPPPGSPQEEEFRRTPPCSFFSFGFAGIRNRRGDFFPHGWQPLSPLPFWTPANFPAQTNGLSFYRSSPRPLPHNPPSLLPPVRFKNGTLWRLTRFPLLTPPVTLSQFIWRFC